jgi:hypothetical protein
VRDGETLLQIKAIKEEKALGVWTTEDLKYSRQCAAAVAKASSVFGLINRHFRHLDIRNFKLLYCTCVRPHVEYCIKSWNPYLVKDIARLEKYTAQSNQIGCRLPSEIVLRETDETYRFDHSEEKKNKG